MNKGLFSGKKGQTIIEMVIGLALMILGLSFAIILVFGGQSLIIDRENLTQARVLAKEGVDAAGLIRDSSWGNLTAGEYGLVFSGNAWQFSGSSDFTENLTRKLIISDIDENTKRIESEVSWSTDPLRTQKVSLVTLMTNWKNAAPPPDIEDTGGSPPTGDWANPETLGSVDLGPGNEASGLDVLDKMVYMSAKAASASKPDFFVINAIDGSNPFVISSINTGTGLNAVDVTDGFAFAANNDPTAQLQVINISNPGSPTLSRSFQLAGTGTDGVGLSIFYANSKIFIGLKKNEGPEFFVLDVSSPTNPVILGGYEINDDVNAIQVFGNKAFLATNKDGAGLMVLNIENPAALSLLGSSFSADGKGLYYMNSSRVLIGLGSSLHIADPSDPQNILNLGNIDLGASVNAISAREALAFVGTSNNNREFQVVNISDPANPILHAFFNFPQVATGVDYEDNLVYVAVRSNDALRIITSSQ